MAASLPLLVTVASWEERFPLGMQALVARGDVGRVLMFYMDETADWSAGNRAEVHALWNAAGVPIDEVRLSVGNPASNWQQLEAQISSVVCEPAKVLVDISTMPREIMWSVFWLSECRHADVDYCYHRPLRYSADWLTRDPQRPRLVFKLSGMAQLGARTALIVVAGYDVERVAQLITFYEPALTLVGLQVANENEDNTKRMEEHRSRFGTKPRVRFFDIDCYAEDGGQSALEHECQFVTGKHNLLMSSLGPKMSAVAMYRLQRKVPEIGLVYAPSREFNRQYSEGLLRTYFGSLSG